MDWTNGLPFLVPVWDSLSQQNLPNKSHNNFDPSNEIDLGGIGTFNNVAFKHHSTFPYKTNRPILPFYVNNQPNTNKLCSTTTPGNRLAYCPVNKLLLAAFQKQLTVLQLNDHSGDKHNFAVDGHSSVNPFCHEIVKIWTTHNLHAISDVKIRSDIDQSVEIIENCGQYLQIFNLNRNEQPLLNWKFQSNFNNLPHCPTADNLSIHLWDQNVHFKEEFLVTFRRHGMIYMLKTDTNTWSIEQSLKLDVNDPKQRFIKIEFLNDLNPFLYVYGTHNKIALVDRRQNLRPGSSNLSMCLASSKSTIYFKPFEMFHLLTSNPCQPHQIITCSDFKVNFFDIRYPNKNLFQCKHMLSSDHLANRILASKSSFDSRLILLVSNAFKSCVMSFDCNLAVQPSMLHVPFCNESPSVINKLFPIQSQCSTIQGLQFMDHASHKDSLFSIATLSDSGHVYLQDFYKDNDQTNTPDGNGNYYHNDFDAVTKEYMHDLLQHLQQTTLPTQKIVPKIKPCSTCAKAGCPNNSQTPMFCTCLASNEQISQELQLLAKPNQQPNEMIFGASNNSPLMEKGSLVKYRDNDQIDFEFIKQNWFQYQHSGSTDDANKGGIRDKCNTLTQQLFDLWCKEDLFDA